ncbi:MAG: M1 family peptidase, partial [Deltaproteobacteria bacterium]|nr:M1 family peptidase [Deltaproteobacteria bacterium]
MGAPRLSLGDARLSERDGAYRIDLAVHQEAPAYRLAVPVVIDTEAGPLRRQIVLKGTETKVTLVAEAAPSAVHLDPAHDLFRRLLPGEAPTILRDITLAEDALTFIVAESAGAEQTARQLAERLLDTTARFGSADASKLVPNPMLIIGITQQVKTFLARVGLDAVPESLDGRGTARVWTARRNRGAPLLV